MSRGLGEVEPPIDLIEGALHMLEDARDMLMRPGAQHKTHKAIAQNILRMRRSRETLFGAELFADPAWDILLDLFVNHEERRPVSVSDLCIAARVPPTTALRYIGLMERRGILARESDPSDGRRVHVRLGAEALKRMRAYLSDLLEEA